MPTPTKHTPGTDALTLTYADLEEAGAALLLERDEWKRVAEKRQAERDEAVALLRRISATAEYDSDVTYLIGVNAVVDTRDFLARLDKEGK